MMNDELGVLRKIMTQFFDAEGRRFFMIFYVFPTFGGKTLSHKQEEICAKAFFLTPLMCNWK
ncbi:MAG: hypothetical protein IPN76_19000 [Saprospiraceae bacterium]|nr:hypothetical protein [Saprospiraceae bacterium]